MRRIALAAVLALVLSTGWMPFAGAAPVGGLECGETVSESVTLTEDLNCAGEMLTLAGEGTVIDLGGHSIGGASVLVTGSGVTVRSGSIDATSAASGSAVFVASGARLDLAGVQVTGAAEQTGVLVDFGAHADVVKSRFQGLGVAVDLFGRGPNSVTGSVFTGNRVGVHVDRSGNEIRGNVFDRNAVGVHIYGLADAAASVNRNIFAGQTETAVRVRSAVDPRVTGVGGEVAGNWIIASRGPGIEIAAVELAAPLALHVSGNVIAFNGSGGPDRDGLRATGDRASLAGVTVSGNYALMNRGRGIDAPGVADGGGNVAFLNRLRPQCVGVVCR